MEDSKTSRKSKLSKSSSERVQVKYLTGKAADAFRERIGLSNSALVIPNKLKGSSESQRPHATFLPKQGTPSK